MASKLTLPSLCMAAIFFLLFFSHSLAIRPILPAASSPSPSPSSFSVAPNDQDLEVVERINNVEQSCEGIGEEECLMRRTLAAHLDYIYTQKQNPS